MEKLLDQNADPNILDFEESYGLISFAYLNKKWKSLDLLLSTELIDINFRNKKDQSTLYGILISEMINHISIDAEG